MTAPRPSRLRQLRQLSAVTPLLPPWAGRRKGAAMQDTPPRPRPRSCPRVPAWGRALPASTARCARHAHRALCAGTFVVHTDPPPPPSPPRGRPHPCPRLQVPRPGRAAGPQRGAGPGEGAGGRAWSRTGHGWDAGGAMGRGHGHGVGVRGGGGAGPGVGLCPGQLRGHPQDRDQCHRRVQGVPHPPQTCTPTCTWCSGGSRRRRGSAGAGRGCRQARGSAAGQVNVSLGCGSGGTGGRGRQQERERWHR